MPVALWSDSVCMGAAKALVSCALRRRALAFVAPKCDKFKNLMSFTINLTCASSKDSDQPTRLPSLISLICLHVIASHSVQKNYSDLTGLMIRPRGYKTLFMLNSTENGV